MMKIVMVVVALLFTAMNAQASELSEWVKAFGYAVACHEGGHAMSGEDVGYPVEMTFDAGGPHYLANVPAYQPNAQLMLQFKSNDKVVAAYNDAIKRGVAPPVTYQQALAAYNVAHSASVELNKEANAWKQDADKRLAYIAGAGFVGQQSCESKITGSLRSKYLIVSGSFYKLGYAAFPKSLQPGVELGDVEAFRSTGGYGVARVALAVSGLSDIYRGVYDPDARWSIGFYRSQRGQPGLILTFVF